MSGQEGSHIDESDLAPTAPENYKVGEKKTLQEYAELDKEDESLAKWKASLGIGAAGGAGDPSAPPKCEVLKLALVSESRASPLEIDLKGNLEEIKKNPITIKEGAEYNVEITFQVSNQVITGLKYIHVVKRAGMKVDKLEAMIGSYGPSAEPVKSRFVTEEAPTGMLARSGSYSVRSRVVDDDGKVYSDWEWAFKIGKEWA